jgi:myo-inositol-1(or 4)-monophosphatase
MMMKELLIECLKRAGKIQLSRFQNIDKISRKESISSIVTEVDLECDKEITGIIQKGFPEHNLLSEETGLRINDSEFTWIIDPLDGTSNYAAGLPWFGVLIAVMKGNIPYMAGAYIPFADKLYLAESGNGATLNGEVLKIENKNIEDVLFGFSMDYTKDDNYLNRGIEIYKFLVKNARNVRTTNSLIDLFNVAENTFGGVINMYNGIWDIAAPYLIIKEAGGIVKDIYGFELEFKTDKNNIYKNYPVITGSPLIVERVLKGILS